MLKTSLFTIGLSALAYASPLLESRQACTDVTVVFARGTFEPPPLGIIVGPPFMNTLQVALGGRTLNFVGVIYPAQLSGIALGGSPIGVDDMVEKVNSFGISCPNTAIVISGYSQGAQIVHRAMDRLTPAVQNRVKAVVTFGDPEMHDGSPAAFNDRFKSFCDPGDIICNKGIQVIHPGHLNYARVMPEAAQFVVDHI